MSTKHDYLGQRNKPYAYEQRGQYEEAIKDYDEVIYLDPGYAAAYLNRGNAYQKGRETTTEPPAQDVCTCPRQ